MGSAEDVGKRTTALAAERSCAGAAHAAAALSTPWCEALLIQCSITMLPLTQIAEPLGVSDILLRFPCPQAPCETYDLVSKRCARGSR